MNSASPQGGSANYMKLAIDSTSWKNNSASPMKFALELDELDEQLGESDEFSRVKLCLSRMASFLRSYT